MPTPGASCRVADGAEAHRSPSPRDDTLASVALHRLVHAEDQRLAGGRKRLYQQPQEHAGHGPR